jgi:glycolate oxidase
MQMPAPDPSVLSRAAEIAARLERAVPGGVLTEEVARRVYETDALTAYRQLPLLVVLPTSTEQVAETMRVCTELGLKVVPRGAGTSLSGGALPLADGVLLGLSKLNRILEVDYDNRTVTCQSGVTNLAITQRVQERGFYYAPDPSSQIACTIGGNIAENSGGVHCLKYGLTTHNVLGLEVVTVDGEILRIGGKHLDPEGYDLAGILTGSEGLLGIVTQATVRILPKPQTARAALLGFPSEESAGDAVAAIIAAGIVPAGMEMMDKAAVHAAENFVRAGYPLDVEALLIVEMDGTAAEVDHLIERVRAIAVACGATRCELSESEPQRLLFWAGRKAAFPAVGRISPDYLCMDGTIPRGKLPFVLKRMRELSREFDLRVVNVFHAGDGNLHPLICFDASRPGELDRAESFGAAILKLCVEVGGVLTGEHGVGVEKRDLMPCQFTSGELALQMRIKTVFDPQWLLNPHKVFPLAGREIEHQAWEH